LNILENEEGRPAVLPPGVLFGGAACQGFSMIGKRTFRAEPVADGLQFFRVVAAQHSVVQCLKADVLLCQLLFGVLMTVDAQLAVQGK